MINGTNTLIEGAINNNSHDMLVILELEYKGNTYIIERYKSAKETSIKVNGKPTSQDAMKFIFDSYEVFISAFAVGDFMKLEETERYAILSSLFPDTSEAIYEKIVGKELAEKYPLNNTSLEGIKKQIKEIEQKNDYAVQRKTLISEQINTLRVTEKPVTDVTEEMIEEARQTLAAHDAIMPKLSSEVKDSTPEIALLKGELAAKKHELRLFEQTVPSRTKIDELKTRYDMAMGQVEYIAASGTCPTCNRPYDPGEIETKKKQAIDNANSILETAKAIRKEYNAEVMGYDAELKNKQEAIRKQEEKLELLNKSLLGAQS
jgi:DNA repair exonuclease SbcCD ATPase subunit